MMIGTSIKRIRRKLADEHGLEKYSQRACAVRCGISAGSWRDLEADRHSPSIDTVVKALKVLGWRIEVRPIE
jgi:transcriptional regulator with XRE-family HTH domain